MLLVSSQGPVAITVLWTQAASLLGYHLSTGSIVSPQSALKPRNSSVVRLFWSPLR